MPGRSSVTRVRLGIYLGDEQHKVGPGKIRLLEAIRDQAPSAYRQSPFSARTHNAPFNAFMR